MVQTAKRGTRVSNRAWDIRFCIKFVQEDYMQISIWSVRDPKKQCKSEWSQRRKNLSMFGSNIRTIARRNLMNNMIKFIFFSCCALCWTAFHFLSLSFPLNEKEGKKKNPLERKRREEDYIEGIIRWWIWT